MSDRSKILNMLADIERARSTIVSLEQDLRSLLGAQESKVYSDGFTYDINRILRRSDGRGRKRDSKGEGVRAVA